MILSCAFPYRAPCARSPTGAVLKCSDLYGKVTCRVLSESLHPSAPYTPREILRVERCFIRLCFQAILSFGGFYGTICDRFGRTLSHFGRVKLDCPILPVVSSLQLPADARSDLMLIAQSLADYALV
jgi:hypothetical protein